jgi:hypothetical protein
MSGGAQSGWGALMALLVACGGVTTSGRDAGAGSPGSDAAPDGGACAVALVPRTGTRVSVGEHHVCASVNGEMVCWGAGSRPVADPCDGERGITMNDCGQAMPPSEPLFEPAAGARHTCALRPDGTATCWGTFAPVPPAGVRFARLSGGATPCGLTFDGTIVCFGLPGYPSPVEDAPPGAGWVDVSAGNGNAACAVRSDCSVKCWGDPALVSGTTAAAFLTHLPTLHARTVSVGGDHACTLDGVTPTCWGSGTTRTSQCLTGTWTECGQSLPPDGRLLSVSCGGMDTCAVLENGSAECWGWASANGTLVPPLEAFAEVSLGGTAVEPFACGVTSDGRIRCWGAAAPPAPPGL